MRIRSCRGSYANLDFGAFQRQAPITGSLKGFIPGGYKLNQDNQIQLTAASSRSGHDQRLHRRRLPRRSGLGGDPDRQPDDGEPRPHAQSVARCSPAGR